MPARKVFNGNIYPTTKGGDVVVIDYKKDTHILVEFVDDNRYQTVTSTTALSRGLIHNPFAKTFYGLGFMGVGRFSTDPKLTTYRVYKAWDGMLNRCHSEAQSCGTPPQRYRIAAMNGIIFKFLENGIHHRKVGMNLNGNLIKTYWGTVRCFIRQKPVQLCRQLSIHLLGLLTKGY